jgi:hypothetical protein
VTVDVLKNDTDIDGDLSWSLPLPSRPMVGDHHQWHERPYTPAKPSWDDTFTYTVSDAKGA